MFISHSCKAQKECSRLHRSSPRNDSRTFLSCDTSIINTWHPSSPVGGQEHMGRHLGIPLSWPVVTHTAYTQSQPDSHGAPQRHRDWVSSPSRAPAPEAGVSLPQQRISLWLSDTLPHFSHLLGRTKCSTNSRAPSTQLHTWRCAVCGPVWEKLVGLSFTCCSLGHCLPFPGLSL